MTSELITEKLHQCSSFVHKLMIGRPPLHTVVFASRLTSAEFLSAFAFLHVALRNRHVLSRRQTNAMLWNTNNSNHRGSCQHFLACNHVLRQSSMLFTGQYKQGVLNDMLSTLTHQRTKLLKYKDLNCQLCNVQSLPFKIISRRKKNNLKLAISVFSKHARQYLNSYLTR